MTEVAPHLVAEKESSESQSPGPEEASSRQGSERKEKGREVRKGILGGSVAAVAVITLLLFLHGQREMPLPPQYETVSRNSTRVPGRTGPERESKKLMIACQERTWIRIVIDGAEKKEVMFNPEEVVMFTAKDTFDLLVGNAGASSSFSMGRETKVSGEKRRGKRVTCLRRGPCYMIILGLDPGLASTGFGAIFCGGTSPTLRTAGYISTSARDPIAKDSSSSIRRHQSAEVTRVKSGTGGNRKRFFLVRYPRAGIVLGEVLGIIYLSAHQHQVPILEITPKEVKNALVGSGSATKKQIKSTKGGFSASRSFRLSMPRTPLRWH